jgi:RNA polymerase sigma factor (sigma-70 family)
MQDVWVAILTQLPQFQLDPRRGTLRAWLRVLIRRVSAKSLRRARMGGLRCPVWTAAEQDLSGRERGPDERWEERRRQRLVQHALAALRVNSSERSYQVIHHHDIEEMTVREVAERLALTPKQVRDRLRRMRANLRGLLDPSLIPENISTHQMRGRSPSKNSLCC